MAENLDQVKEELYKIFNVAVKKQPDHEGYSYERAIQGRDSISRIAQAIVALEREQRLAKQNSRNRLDKD
jgi:hypothetical protein